MNVVSESVGQLVPLDWLDTVVIVFYFVAVLGLGFLLKRQTNILAVKASDDYIDCSKKVLQ